MNLRNEIEAAIREWNSGLDSGDIERMVATCHPDVMTVNERQPVTIGTQAIRDKYNPRIAAAEITSGYDIEDLQSYGDTVIVSGRFYGTMKMRGADEIKSSQGRLVLGYKRDGTGAWKMFLDIDNNGPA